jgi:hypothetical protein
MPKQVSDHVTRRILVPDLHDEVSTRLSVVDSPLRCRDRGLDLPLIDWHPAFGIQKISLKVNEQKRPTVFIDAT